MGICNVLRVWHIQAIPILIVYRLSDTYDSCSQKNGDPSVLFRPIQMPLHHSCQPFHFHSICNTCIISNWAWSFNVQKKGKASLSTHHLESIVSYCYGLLNCSGEVHYCCSSILSEFCDRGSTGFEVCYRQSIDLTLPIDSDRLQMRSLG